MSEHFTIRRAIDSDIPQIIELIQEFAEFESLTELCVVSENDLREAVFSEQSFVHCLIAETENSFVGYAIFFPVFKSFRGERSMFLEDLYVSPNMRGRGVGLELLKEVARAARVENCVRMDWQALKWNTPALEFYRRLGALSDDENLDFSLREAAFEKLAG